MITLNDYLYDGDTIFRILQKYIDDLKKSENTFAHERYSFEIIPGKSYGLQCDFLLTFSRTLNILAKSLK